MSKAAGVPRSGSGLVAVSQHSALGTGEGCSSPQCLCPALSLITAGAEIPRQERSGCAFTISVSAPVVPVFLCSSLSPKGWASLKGSAVTLLFCFAPFPCSGVKGDLFQAQISSCSGLKPCSSHDVEKPIFLSRSRAAGAEKWCAGGGREGRSAQRGWGCWGKPFQPVLGRRTQAVSKQRGRGWA